MGDKVSLGLTGLLVLPLLAPTGRACCVRKGLSSAPPWEFCALGGVLATKGAISRAPLCLHLKRFGVYFKKNFVS